MPRQAHYKRNSLIIVLFMAVILVAGTWVNSFQSIDSDKNSILDQEIRSHFKIFKKQGGGEPLPSITVLNVGGSTMDLAENEGRFTVLNIWATWCTPCIKELPYLQKLSDVMDDDWRVVAVSIDMKPDKIESFTAKTGAAEIANYHDTNGELQKAINIIQLPVTYILDDQNTVLYEIGGDAVWNDALVVDFLKSLSANKIR